MFPNASATPCNVFGNLLLAKADKVFDFVTWQVLESLQAVSIIDAFGQTSSLCGYSPNHILSDLFIVLDLRLIVAQKELCDFSDFCFAAAL